jgi:hypothetical protein
MSRAPLRSIADAAVETERFEPPAALRAPERSVLINVKLTAAHTVG